MAAHHKARELLDLLKFFLEKPSATATTQKDVDVRNLCVDTIKYFQDVEANFAGVYQQETLGSLHKRYQQLMKEDI